LRLQECRSSTSGTRHLRQMQCWLSRRLF